MSDRLESRTLWQRRTQRLRNSNVCVFFSRWERAPPLLFNLFLLSLSLGMALFWFNLVLICIVWMFFVLDQTLFFLTIWLLAVLSLTVGTQYLWALYLSIFATPFLFYLFSLKLLYLQLLLFVDTKLAFLILAIVVIIVWLVWATLTLGWKAETATLFLVENSTPYHVRDFLTYGRRLWHDLCIGD